MLNRFYFLVILKMSILALSVSDTFQTGSDSSYGRYGFSVPSSEFEPVNTDCQYNNTYPSSFSEDFSNCAKILEGNPGSIRYPNVETFADGFTKAMLSIPALQRFLKKHIPVCESKDIFYKLDYKLLKDIGYLMPEYPAYAIAETLGLYDDFPVPLYFKVVGFTTGKFLQIENLEIGHNAVRCYGYFLERALQSSCIINDEALYQVFLDGFVNFVKSLGFNFLEKSNLFVHLFTGELLAFVNK